MAATSVTGVSFGSAQPSQSSQRMFIGVDRLVGPRYTEETEISIKSMKEQVDDLYSKNQFIENKLEETQSQINDQLEEVHDLRLEYQLIKKVKSLIALIGILQVATIVYLLW